jgi:AcrR family transcriptional regulator
MITTVTKQGRRKRSGGRPKQFDEGEALERAMYVFWKKGYEGTSMSDLTAAMEINPPSLYRTFGNKEALFWKALARYGEGRAAYVMECLQEPTAFEVVKARLDGAVQTMTDPRHPWGCLATQAAATCGDEGESVRRGLISVRAGTQAAMAERFERARAEGDLPEECDPKALACYISTLVLGISMQAASGVSRKELLQIVDDTLAAWPVLIRNRRR